MFDILKMHKIADPDMDTENIEAEMDKHDTHITVILNKIIERDTSSLPIHFPAVKSQAFPSVFRRSAQKSVDKRSLTGESSQTRKPRVGCSIFARQFKQIIPNRRYEIQEDGIKVERDMKSIATSSAEKMELPSPNSAFLSSKLISGDGLRMNVTASPEFGLKETQNIHVENVQRLKNLEESEILSERNKLLGNLDPKLIKLLQNKKSGYKVQKEFEKKQNVKSTEENFLDDLAKESKVAMDDVREGDNEMDNEISGMLLFDAPWFCIFILFRKFNIMGEDACLFFYEIYRHLQYIFASSN